jgi:cytochrome c-type biogenesis protein CcmH
VTGGRALLIAAALLSLAAAADPADQLRNPAREAHARTLFREIRCVVCQSESIDESDADIARDLRQFVRNEVAAGANDDQIKALLVQRYGEFVLLEPRFSPGNAALWLAPFAVVAVGAGVLLLRRRRGEPAKPLSQSEERRLSALTDN